MRGGALALILVGVGCTYDWTVVPAPRCKATSDCASDAYCVFADELCGSGAGSCEPRPVTCGEEQPACGCDGSSVAGKCALAASGVDVAPPGKICK